LPQEKEIPALEFEKANTKDMFVDPNTVDKIFGILKKHPDERVKQIFEMRYLDPDYNKLTPWREVGKKLNLSIQGCINIHNQALPYIRKHLSKHEINFQRTN
jgi:DNA-directed RNA polymerase sigma subunit (sigma70/sigma32)